MPGHTSCTPFAAGVAVLSDRELVAELPHRPNEACAELQRRHRRAVEAAVRMVLGNRAECSDIEQEVFESLWLTPSRFDPEKGSLVAFLRLQARYRGIDLLRSEASRHRREAGAPTAWYGEPAPDELAVEHDSGARLRGSVGRLPAAERTAVMLAFFEELPYRSVAERLEQPEGTVKSRIRKGLTRLRAEYGSLHAFEEGTLSSST
jgi:RNA polymerase sigma-70 factor (ECF subfamily)